MYPWSYDTAGRFDEHVLASEALRGNPLGDPHERPLWVYVPPGYDDEPARRYPSIYVIQGYTGQLDMWRNRARFGAKTFPELTDELFASGEVPPCVVVWVDAWTSLGGSQFLDSPATGRYHTYLCDEVVPWVDERYRTLAAPEHRGIQGKSSGGYGAMITPLLRPELFGALATHAGDALFETCYARDFAPAVRALRDEYDGSWDAFWEDFRSGRPVLSKPTDEVLVNTYAMSAAYSARDDGTIDFPFDAETGELDPEVWARWLKFDPVLMAREERHRETLRSLRAIWIDAGTSDEWFLDLGATAFRDGLARIGVPTERVAFALFDAGHGGIEYRYPQALAWLAHRLAR
jgi:S-formylglutathione hydrolase FrmB